MAVFRTAGREPPNLSNFLNRVQSDVVYVTSALRGHELDNETIDSCIYISERCLTNVRRVGDLLGQEAARAWDVALTDLLNTCREAEDNQTLRNNITGFSSPRNAEGRMGAPKYDISLDQLESLILELQFPARDVAKLLNVSLSTVRRRMKEYGISVQGTYARLTENEIDELVREVTFNNTRLGYRSVRTRLANKGFRLPFQMVRESMLRVDPAGVALRMSNTITRRRYSVPGPNALWHLDGNHKLIRWKFVIHGCVDGFSRCITFMKIVNNNRARTVLNSFLEAIAKWKMPSRIRHDYGGENVEVARFVTYVNGPGRGSVITGPSVHNTRIERLWVDLFQGCTSVYYSLFYNMEEDGILDASNPVDLFCLHYAFQESIQEQINLFVHCWNSHPLSSERSRTPLQLYWRGALTMMNMQRTGIRNIFDEPVNIPEALRAISLPVDEGPLPSVSLVEVPESLIPLSEAQFQRLKEEINPTTYSQDGLGIDTYLATQRFTRQCLNQ